MSRLQKYLSKHSSNTQNSAAIAYLAALDHIETVAPSITASIIQELKDERTHLKLIASENFSSLAVQLAMGNLLTDKYAEGYAHHRFYAGCDNVFPSAAVYRRASHCSFWIDGPVVQENHCLCVGASLP